MVHNLEVWFLLFWSIADVSLFSRGFLPLQGSVASHQGDHRLPVYEGQAYPTVRHASEYGSDYSDNVNQFHLDGAFPRPYSPPISSNPYPYLVQQGYTGSQAYQSQSQGYPETKKFGSDYQSDTANRMIVVSKSFGKGKIPGLHRTRTGTLQVNVNYKQSFIRHFISQ